MRADESAQERSRRQFERECRLFDCVGWWHTHPGALQLFYSSVDRQNQVTWSDPDAIGIVLNPHLRGEGLKVFRGPESVELKPTKPEAIDRLRRTNKPASQTPSQLPRIPATRPTRRVAAKRPEPVNRVCHDSRTAAAVAVCLAVVALLVAVLTHLLLWTRTLAVVEPPAYSRQVPTVMLVEVQPRIRDTTASGNTDGQRGPEAPSLPDLKDQSIPDTSMAALARPAPVDHEPQDDFGSGILTQWLAGTLTPKPDSLVSPSDSLAEQDELIDLSAPEASVRVQPLNAP